MIDKLKMLITRKQQSATANDMAEYRKRLTRAIDNASEREVDALLELAHRLGRNLAADADLYAKAAGLRGEALELFHADHRDLFGGEKRKVYLLPYAAKRKAADYFEMVLRTVKHVESGNPNLPVRVSEIEADHDAEFARMGRQEKAIAKSGIRAVAVGPENVAGIASDLVKRYTFQIAPEQNQAEFNDLKKLVVAHGANFRTSAEALAAAL